MNFSLIRQIIDRLDKIKVVFEVFDDSLYDCFFRYGHVVGKVSLKCKENPTTYTSLSQFSPLGASPKSSPVKQWNVIYMRLMLDEGFCARLGEKWGKLKRGIGFPCKYRQYRLTVGNGIGKAIPKWRYWWRYWKTLPIYRGGQPQIATCATLPLAHCGKTRRVGGFVLV